MLAAHSELGQTARRQGCIGDNICDQFSGFPFGHLGHIYFGKVRFFRVPVSAACQIYPAKQLVISRVVSQIVEHDPGMAIDAYCHKIQFLNYRNSGVIVEKSASAPRIRRAVLARCERPTDKGID
jgi:hypothetical protein